MDAQLKRGFLDVCVLASINRQDSYGYQIVKDVPSSLHLTESTLYHSPLKHIQPLAISIFQKFLKTFCSALIIQPIFHDA